MTTTKSTAIIPSSVPDLENYQAASLELCPEYWSPAAEGEQRRAVYLGIESKLMPSADDPAEMVELECACFIHKQNGTARTFANGSKRLVAVFYESGKIGTPYQLTYLGRQENKSNSKSSDAWSVVELRSAAPEDAPPPTTHSGTTSPEQKEHD